MSNLDDLLDRLWAAQADVTLLPAQRHRARAEFMRLSTARWELRRRRRQEGS